MICLEGMGWGFFSSFLRLETRLKLCIRHKAALGDLRSSCWIEEAVEHILKKSRHCVAMHLLNWQIFSNFVLERTIII